MIKDDDRLCPYMTRTIVYHSKVDNPNIPKYGITKMYDYDIADVKFNECIQEKCMMYDRLKRTCKFVDKSYKP